MKNKIIKTGLIIAAILALAGCAAQPQTESSKDSPSNSTAKKEQPAQTLYEARQNFKTTIVDAQTDDYPVAPPPEGIFETVQFESSVGSLPAYITPNPGDGQKHPAIIWLIGGWSNSLSTTPWSISPSENDQSAKAFRDAGIVTMFPSERGGNENTNSKECWYGELDDIMSAYDYLAALDYVDPDRIYLGGHSTGGSQALLLSEYSDKFRAIFSFGPKSAPTDSDSSYLTFDTTIEEETTLRSPVLWLDSITQPTFIFEGEYGNDVFLEEYRDAAKESTKSDLISTYLIEGADHFSVLAPITPLIAQKIVADTGDSTNISFSDSELAAAMENPVIATTDYANEANTFQISVPGDWEKQADDSDDDLTLTSLDHHFFLTLSRYEKADLGSYDDFITALKDQSTQEGITLSEATDLVIDNATTAKHFLCTIPQDDETIISDLILIETDRGYYYLSIDSYEEDHQEMEADFARIPLTFKEL